MPRHFTVAEANALLPVLRPHIVRLIAAWRRLTATQEQVVAILERAPRADLGGPPLNTAASDIIRAQNAMVAIQGLGQGDPDFAEVRKIIAENRRKENRRRKGSWRSS